MLNVASKDSGISEIRIMLRDIGVLDSFNRVWCIFASYTTVVNNVYFLSLMTIQNSSDTLFEARKKAL